MEVARRTSSQGAVGVANHNTPRTIRTRLTNPRRKVPAEAPMVAALAEAPAQMMARSASGRMAMGPWMGSFGGLADVAGGLLDARPPSPTLFATSQGRVFADLAGSAVDAQDLLAAAAAAGGGAEVATAGVAGRQAAHAVVGELAGARGKRWAQEQEGSVLRRKATAPRAPAAQRAPAPNAALRKHRAIGQARKAN